MSNSLIEVIRNSEQKKELWQWDTGRQIKITLEEDSVVDEVHFSNAYSKDALVVKPQVNAEGNIVADIPNILLWQVFPINVYVVMDFPNGKGTIYEEQLKINSRKKPSDYVYTETEILNYLDLEKRIKALEENGMGGGIKDETDPTVPQWAKQPTKPSYTAEEVGAPSKEEFDKLSEEVDDLKSGTSGMSSTAKTLLINILRNAVYENDQSTNITLLEAELSSSSGGNEPIEPEKVYYYITNNLTNVSNNNTNTQVIENGSYVANLSADTGYVIDEVTVTMGGTDITASAYVDGVITINSIIGNIIITASAVKEESDNLLEQLEVYEGYCYKGFPTIKQESAGFCTEIFDSTGMNTLSLTLIKEITNIRVNIYEYSDVNGNGYKKEIKGNPLYVSNPANTYPTTQTFDISEATYIVISFNGTDIGKNDITVKVVD